MPFSNKILVIQMVAASDPLLVGFARTSLEAVAIVFTVIAVVAKAAAIAVVAMATAIAVVVARAVAIAEDFIVATEMATVIVIVAIADTATAAEPTATIGIEAFAAKIVGSPVSVTTVTILAKMGLLAVLEAAEAKMIIVIASSVPLA